MKQRVSSASEDEQLIGPWNVTFLLPAAEEDQNHLKSLFSHFVGTF